MKISIITVCKNPGERIKKTVESVQAQTYQNIEHIVIDGASTDGTVEWLSGLAAVKSEEGLSLNPSPKGKGLSILPVPLGKGLGERSAHDSRFTFKFFSSPDTGIYNAMNKGIDHSTGNYLLFLNAGDYLFDKNTISDVVENINKDNFQADIYFGDIISEDPASETRYKAPNRLAKINSLKLFFWCVPHAASFIRKSFFIKTGGYDERFKISGDYDFFVKALINENAKFKYFAKSVSVFLTDGISSDVRYRKLLKHENLQIIRKYYGYLPGVLYNNCLVLFLLRFAYKIRLKFEEKS